MCCLLKAMNIYLASETINLKSHLSLTLSFSRNLVWGAYVPKLEWLGSLLYEQDLGSFTAGHGNVLNSSLPGSGIVFLVSGPRHTPWRGAGVKCPGSSPPVLPGRWDSWPLALQEKTEHLSLCLRVLGDRTGHRCCLEWNRPCVIFVLPEGQGTLALVLLPLRGTGRSVSKFHSNSGRKCLYIDTKSYPASRNQWACLLVAV